MKPHKRPGALAKKLRRLRAALRAPEKLSDEQKEKLRAEMCAPLTTENDLPISAQILISPAPTPRELAKRFRE